jgi:pimeloyl-ACP methyl ester carboxylesterase
MSRRYFDIDVDGTYSMARYLASKGATVVTVDPPAVGESGAPPDAWDLTAPVVGEVCAEAVAELATMLPGARLVGAGHSAGALLTVYAQAQAHCFEGLALLGFAGGGLPSVLTPEELALAHPAGRVDDEIVALAKARFGRPLPQGTTGPSEMLLGVPVAVPAKAGIAEAGGALLAVVGLTSMIPGASASELASIDVPVFLAVGDHDITGAPHVIPGQFPGARDITLYVLADSGHNHNVAPTRRQLWDRLWSWATSI